MARKARYDLPHCGSPIWNKYIHISNINTNIRHEWPIPFSSKLGSVNDEESILFVLRGIDHVVVMCIIVSSSKIAQTQEVHFTSAASSRRLISIIVKCGIDSMFWIIICQTELLSVLKVYQFSICIILYIIISLVFFKTLLPNTDLCRADWLYRKGIVKSHMSTANNILKKNISSACMTDAEK